MNILKILQFPSQKALRPSLFALLAGALAFEDQLAPRLAEHLNEVYGGGGQGKDPEDLGMIQMGVTSSYPRCLLNFSSLVLGSR